MEISFADKQNGGVFDANLIPGLTEFAHNHIDFSGNSGKLNGAYPLPGTGWTMAAIFALNTGLPLQLGIGGNEMDTQESFFSNITALGDILHKNGYIQEVLMGSNSFHAGQDKFFKKHGKFKILDYNYLKINKKYQKTTNSVGELKIISYLKLQKMS